MRSFLLAVISTALAAVAPCAAAQSISLPTPTGPNAVGYWSTPLETTTLDALTPEPGDHRTVFLEIWYPALASEAAPKPYSTPFITNDLRGAFPFPEGFADTIVTHAAAGQQPAEGRYPVIVFSHGLSWPITLYQSLAEDLASRGFVVVGVNHPHAASVDFGGGRTRDRSLFPRSEDSVAWDAILSQQVEPIADDLRFVISELRRWQRRSNSNNPLAVHIDAMRLGIAGHSLGATAAARLSADVSVRGIFLMEGLPRTADNSPITTRVPLLHMIGEYNRLELEGGSYRPTAGAPVFQVVVGGAGHAYFSDLIYLYSNFADDDWRARHRNETAPDRIIQISRDYLAAFFGRYLRDEEMSSLLRPVSYSDRVAGPRRAGYPEVELSVSVY